MFNVGIVHTIYKLIYCKLVVNNIILQNIYSDKQQNTYNLNINSL